MKPSYEQIATTFDLWQEYADPQSTWTEDEFEARTYDEKVYALVAMFGPEGEG